MSFDTIFEKKYKVNKYNPPEKFGLFSLLKMLQDAARGHASLLGFGYKDSWEKGFFWVLARQKLRVSRWPNSSEVLNIKTWSKPILGIFAIREFEIFVGQEKIAECSTTWMILDTNTRKPKKIEGSEEIFKPSKDYGLDFSAGKISLPANMETVMNFAVETKDLDANNHVNNTRYTKWILNALENESSRMIKEYEINFSKETFLADEIEIFSHTVGNPSSQNQEVFFKADRVHDSATVFTARIHVVPM